MATFILLNSIVFAGRTGPTWISAGSTINSATQDTTKITAAGGVLWPSADPQIAAAAVAAVKAKKNGADDVALNFIMQAGVNNVAKQQEQIGSAVLVAGTVVVSGLSLTPQSTVLFNLTTPGGTLGAAYKVVLNVGAGTATFTAIDTAGALVNTDTSTLSYVVVG